MTLLSSLLLDTTATPLMVALALAAACVRVIEVTPAEGSKARADRPAASVLLASASTTPMRKPFSAPVCVERSTSREPVVSVTMDAVTPAWAALIASRTLCRLSAPAAMLTSTALAPDFGVKLVWSALQVPSSMCRLPWPTTLVGAV